MARDVFQNAKKWKVGVFTPIAIVKVVFFATLEKAKVCIFHQENLESVEILCQKIKMTCGKWNSPENNVAMTKNFFHFI